MTNRIEYLDALRGFVMLLVVLGHVPMYCYHHLNGISFSAIPSTFHLALFFFISGNLEWLGRYVMGNGNPTVELFVSPAIAVELKYGSAADTAISQIQQKNYSAKVAESAGRLLLVGISYDSKSKKHSCVIKKWFCGAGL